jgi:hypothetical protein
MRLDSSKSSLYNKDKHCMQKLLYYLPYYYAGAVQITEGFAPKASLVIGLFMSHVLWKERAAGSLSNVRIFSSTRRDAIFAAYNKDVFTFQHIVLCVDGMYGLWNDELLSCTRRELGHESDDSNDKDVNFRSGKPVNGSTQSWQALQCPCKNFDGKNHLWNLCPTSEWRQVFCWDLLEFQKIKSIT